MLISTLLNRKRININVLIEWPLPSTSFIGEQKWTGAFGEPGFLGPFLQHPHPHINWSWTLTQLSHVLRLFYTFQHFYNELQRYCSSCSLVLLKPEITLKQTTDCGWLIHLMLKMTTKPIQEYFTNFLIQVLHW